MRVADVEGNICDGLPLRVSPAATTTLVTAVFQPAAVAAGEGGLRQWGPAAA